MHKSAMATHVRSHCIRSGQILLPSISVHARGKKCTCYAGQRCLGPAVCFLVNDKASLQQVSAREVAGSLQAGKQLSIAHAAGGHDRNCGQTTSLPWLAAGTTVNQQLWWLSTQPFDTTTNPFAPFHFVGQICTSDKQGMMYCVVPSPRPVSTSESQKCRW